MQIDKLVAFVFAAALVPVAGCTSGKPSGLPIGSELVVEKWLPIRFNAEEDGRLFIWDQGHHRMTFETDLRRGEGVWLDFTTGWIFLGSTPVKGRIDPYARHQLFFSRAATRPVTHTSDAGAEGSAR